MDDIEIVCTTCGERNPARNEFCFNCGTFLAWEDSRHPGQPPTSGFSPVVGPPPEDHAPAGTHYDSTTRDQARAPDAYGIYREVAASGPDDPATFDTPETRTGQLAAGSSPTSETIQQLADNSAASEPAGAASPEHPGEGSTLILGQDLSLPSRLSADDGTNAVDQAATDASTEPIAEEPTAANDPAEFACPACGTANPDTRRYCRHCGTGFYPEWNSSAAAGPSWTPEAVAAHDREAERAYRRSLPVLYRWRRVLIGVVVLALCGGLGFVIARGPVAMAEDGWHRVLGNYVTIAGVSVKVVPKNATAPGSNPQALIDGTKQEWSMIWRPSGTATCGAAPGTGVVEFTFPATRVRRIVIASGLAADNPNSLTQPRPKVVGISFDDGPCQPRNLDNTPDQQRLRIDSGQPVQKLSLGISEAYPGEASQISLTEVWIQTYPSQ